MFFFPIIVPKGKPLDVAFEKTAMSGLILIFLWNPPFVTLQPTVISSKMRGILNFFVSCLIFLINFIFGNSALVGSKITHAKSFLYFLNFFSKSMVLLN